MAENKLPALRSSRLPWHPIFEEYGIQRTDWQALVEAVFPAAQNLDSIRMALSYCRRRNLDPFKRVIHIVPVWDRKQSKLVDTIWPGIAELRTTAFRTSLYAGREPTEWGPDRELSFDNTTLNYPEWAQVTVHRLDKHGNPRPYPGPRVYWLESYATRSHDTVAPNEMWRRRTRGQLDKCAEAAALRAAFPEEIGNDYTSEEMEGQVVDHAPATEDVAVKAPALRGNEALRSRLQPTDDRPPPTAKGDRFYREPVDETEEFSGTVDTGPSQPDGEKRTVFTAPAPDEPTWPSGRPRRPPGRPRLGQPGALAARRIRKDEPTDEEIESSQAGHAAVLGAEEVEAEGDPAAPVVIKPQRLKNDRGWDWPTYADELIAAALRTPIAELGRLRGANAPIFDVLRNSDLEQWQRVNQALADYEREGVPG